MGLQYSVLISATGSELHTVYHDLCLVDVMRACQKHIGTTADDEASEHGDSEYSYLASENGGFEEFCHNLLERADCEDSPYDRAYVADWINDRWGDELRSWFWCCQDYQASGIISFEDLKSLCEDMGAYPSGTETMGTLGGPANWCGLAPDIDFCVESQEVIVCMRVTPLPNAERRTEKLNSERMYKALEAFTIEQLSC